MAKQLGIKFENLIGDVLVSSGVVAYLGAFTAAFRQEQTAEWVNAAATPISLVLTTSRSQGLSVTL